MGVLFAYVCVCIFGSLCRRLHRASFACRTNASRTSFRLPAVVVCNVLSEPVVAAECGPFCNRQQRGKVRRLPRVAGNVEQPYAAAAALLGRIAPFCFPSRTSRFGTNPPEIRRRKASGAWPIHIAHGKDVVWWFNHNLSRPRHHRLLRKGVRRRPWTMNRRRRPRLLSL